MISSYWNRLSGREKFLAVLTSGMIFVGVGYLVTTRAVDYLSELNDRVEQLELDLYNLQEQDARAEGVNKAFENVVAMHSSQWTEQEIHDRLRREIYRLALWKPTPEGKEEQATSRSRSKDYMIQIPRLREGTLREDVDGYREYQINLRLAPTNIGDVLHFVQRIQGSRQMLRIDTLDLSRSPKRTEVAAAMEVTRTVLDNPRGESAVAVVRKNYARNSSFEDWDDATRSFIPWQSEECAIRPSSQYATDRNRCLQGISKSAEGAVYQAIFLEAGRAYELELDVASHGPLSLSVRDRDNRILGDAIAILGDGTMNHYRIRFNPPGNEGDLREMLAPHFQVDDAGTRFFVDNVSLVSLED